MLDTNGTKLKSGDVIWLLNEWDKPYEAAMVLKPIEGNEALIRIIGQDWSFPVDCSLIARKVKS